MRRKVLMCFFILSLVAVNPARAEEVTERNTWAGSWHFDKLDELVSNLCVPTDGGTCTKTVTGVFTGDYSGNHATGTVGGTNLSTGGKLMPWSVVFQTPGTATLTYSSSGVQGEIVFPGPDLSVSYNAFGAYANYALVPAAIVAIDGKLNLSIADDTVTATALLLKVYVYGQPIRWETVINEDLRSPA